MKILRITLRNLASIAGTHTVDFTAGALQRTGLYVICGATGSGKSTLLDALCLALYESTPRLDHVSGRVKLADTGGEITQDDPRNLLRRGTAEGFAEVAFVGVDGAVYTARWSVRRARDKASGKLQHSEMALYSGNVLDGAGVSVEAGKKTEVKPAIEAKIGLSYAQFTRAVLLAQNDFAAFLKADDKDRAEILQALTDTPQFEQISRLVFERNRVESDHLLALKMRVQGSAPLPADEREAAETALASAEIAYAQAQAAFAVSEVHVSWFHKLRELTALQQEAQTALDRATAAQEGAAPRRQELEHTREALRDAKPLADAELRISRELESARTAQNAAAEDEADARAQVERAEAELKAGETANAAAQADTGAARPLLIRARDLDSRLLPLGAQLRQAVADREAAELARVKVAARRDELVTSRQAAQGRLATTQAQLQRLAHLEPFARDSAAWLERFDRAQQDRAALERAVADLAVRDSAAGQARQTLQNKGAQAGRAKTLAQEASQHLVAAEEALAKYDQDGIAARRDSAVQARAQVEKFEKAFSFLQELTLQAADLQKELTHLQEAQQRDQLDLEFLRTKRLQAAEEAAAAARHAYDLAAAAVEDAAVRFRQLLVQGMDCPVCGSKEHPFAEHLPNAALQALKRDWEGKELASKHASAQALALSTGLQERAQRLDERAQALAKLDLRLTTGRGKTAELASTCGLAEVPPQEVPGTIAATYQQLDAEFAAVQKEEAARRQAEKRLHQVRAESDAARQAVETLSAELAALETQAALAAAALKQAQQERERLGHASQKAESELAPLAAALAQGITERDLARDFAEFTQLNHSQVELLANLRELEAALEPVQEQFAQADQVLTTRRTEETEARSSHQALLTQRAELFGGRAAAEVEAELEQKALHARDALQRLAQNAAELKQGLSAAVAAHQGRRQVYQAQLASLGEARAALDEWLLSFSARTMRSLDRPGLHAMLARGASWLEQEQAALDALDKAVTRASAALNVRREQLAPHLATQPTVKTEAEVSASLATLRGQRDLTEEARNAARAALAADDLRRTQNQELLLAQDAANAAARPWQQLNDLIGSADGAKFRSIAQRKTLDILLSYANAQLAQLSARYQLERLRDSLNMVVVDREMGDERRSVHSLSGGESFLVSLALALGLASLTSNRLRIESLFIDEGFGSLDQDTLATALNALTQLEAQGRKVGVISHVVELSEAIPVQIRVERTRSGASKIVVPTSANSHAEALFT